MPTKNILAIRLSAMGDVALSVPAIQAVCAQNPDVHMHLITKKPFQIFFQGIPNLSFVSADLYGRHKGFLGLFRLYKELKVSLKPVAFVDLHNVLRSKILRFFFGGLGKTPCFKIDKGRAEKKKLTQKEDKVFQQLTHSTERYAQVFRKAGFSADLSSFQPIRYVVTQSIETFLAGMDGKKIGIAPFAQHKGKAYPIEQMEEVVSGLAKAGWHITLFGGGKSEEEIARQWEQEYTTVKSAVGKFKFAEELALMSQMDKMLTMDSGNMHLARLVGTPVYSIWGATHPFAGFTPFGQSDNEKIIQVPVSTLSCRPCSVFGNKACHRGDWACMKQITPTIVLEKLDETHL